MEREQERGQTDVCGSGTIARWRLFQELNPFERTGESDKGLSLCGPLLTSYCVVVMLDNKAT
jgi:hypothetical protein